MNYRRKLKPGNGINMFLPIIVSYAIFLISLAMFGLSVSLIVFGTITLFFGVMTLIPYKRTKNLGFIITSIYMFVLTMFLYTLPAEVIGNSSRGKLPPVSGLLLTIILVMAIWLFYLMLKRKLKWRGTEIFELAASNISESKESYTSRPRPVDKLDYSRSELINFTDFLQRNLISLAFIEDTRIVITPIRNYEEVPYLYKPNIDYHDRSWVAFNSDGNVTVNISKRDYLYYRDDLDFNELCDSLGKLYLEFFELFTKGNEVRIIDQMDELKVGLLS